MQLKSLPKEIIILSKLYYQDNINKITLHKTLDITYSWVCDILKEMERLKYIKREEIGRCIYIKLTDKGKKIAKCCNELVNCLEQDD